MAQPSQSPEVKTSSLSLKSRNAPQNQAGQHGTGQLSDVSRQEVNHIAAPPYPVSNRGARRQEIARGRHRSVTTYLTTPSPRRLSVVRLAPMGATPATRGAKARVPSTEKQTDAYMSHCFGSATKTSITRPARISSAAARPHEALALKLYQPRPLVISKVRS